MTDMKKRILTRDDFEKLSFNKITIPQIKSTLKNYEIKFKSNIRKKDLYDILKNYFYKDRYDNIDINKITLIQKRWKKKKIFNNLKVRGIGYFNRDLCANDTEFATLQDLKEIPENLFISMIENKKVYGFDLTSLGEMFEENIFNNPYTQTEFSKEFINKVNQKYNNYLKNLKTVQSESPIKLTAEEKHNNRIFKFFHECNIISGNFVDDEWFKELNRFALIKFYEGLEDIWNYRANLTKEMKEKYIPSEIKVFDKISEVRNPKNNKQAIQSLLLDDFEKFLKYPKYEEDKITTTMWIITALVDVSEKAQMNLSHIVQMY